MAAGQAIGCFGLTEPDFGSNPGGMRTVARRDDAGSPQIRGIIHAAGITEGQLLTEHSSPRAVVVTLLTGTMDFDIETVTYSMVAGDVLYMAPGANHALRATSKCHMQLVMVDTEA